MSLSDEQLGAALVSYAEPAAAAHPAAEELWALAAGELEPAASRTALEHVARCPACAEDLRLTRGMVAEAAGVEAEAAGGDADRASAPWPPRPLPALRGWWLPALAAAALAVLAVGLGWFPQPSPQPPVRDGGGEVVRSLLGPGGALPRTDARLRWAGPEGARYDVTVTTEELRVLARARDVERTELRLSPGELAGLPAGTVLFWRVEATLPGGERAPPRTFEARLE